MSSKKVKRAKELLNGGKAWENRNKIFALLFSALKEHDSEAADLLAGIYTNMELTDYDYDKCCAYVKLSKDFDDPEGLLVWAEDIQSDSIYSLMLKKKAADKGYPKAMFEYGRSIYYQNPYESIKYMKMAADKGYPKAMYILAKASWFGYSILVNHKKAFKYMNMAAKAEYSDAFFYLGYMYDLGLGTKKNHKKAREYFEKVQNYKCFEAKGFLGRQMILGLGIKKNVKEGFKMLKDGVDMSYYPEPELLITLAKCYHNGIGVEIDHKKGDEYLDMLRIQHDETRGERIW